MSTDQSSPTPIDVVNQSKLIAYCAFRERSLQQLKTDPVHNVYSQIVAMIDRDRTWRLINQTRGLARERKATDPEWRSAAQNGMLADFMDAGHVAMQTLAIRRLLEEKQSNPRGQIISLRRVVAAVKGNRSLITRENFVCHDGLPYDPAPGAARALTAAAEKPDEMHWIATKGREGWDMAETLHEAFDTLSGVSRDRRSRDDLIRVAYFDELEAQFEDPGFAALEAYANKFVAHSADERSREAAGGDIDVTIERIATCHAAIIKVFHALIADVFQVATHSPVAYRSDPFHNLDQAWVATDQLTELRQWWILYMNNLEALVGVSSSGG